MSWSGWIAFFICVWLTCGQAIAAWSFCGQDACSIQIPSYSRPIRIFHGRKFNPSNEVHLAYYFHGWWTAGLPSPFEGQAGDFARFVEQSETNTLLIIPESVGQNDTYKMELNAPEKMRRFFLEVESVLADHGLSLKNATRSLSGHSGAYVHLAKMGLWLKIGQLDFPNWTAFGLFDSAYGFRAGLVRIGEALCSRDRGVYLTAYNPSDGYREKKKANQKIMRTLRKNKKCARLNLIEFKSPDTFHLDFPARYLAEFLKRAY